MDNRPIGIFDSGVGGITILKEIQKRLPNENYIYLGDTKNFPYGEKNREEIIKFAIQNVEYLIKKNVKIIVIACGTATSQAIDILQQKFEIPIIGIIKPTVEYIKEKEYKEVGVIATEGTIRSGEWERQLRKNISNINVINKACPMLATIAEEGRATGIEGRNAIKEYMKSFKEKKINKIILGCTHFPIYEQVIRDELKYDVELINTGKTVAKYLEEYLNEKELYTQSKKGNIKIELTKKEIAGAEEMRAFLAELPHAYYDENILHSVLLSQMKDYDTCMEAVEAFLPHIDNWAVCDCLSPKAFAVHKPELLENIREWAKSEHVYTCRFGLEMLMTHFLDDDFKPEYLELPADVKNCV